MIKNVLGGVVALLLAANGYAEDLGILKLGELKSRGATQLSATELQALLPGARVKNVTPAGSTRYWENDVSGKFIASNDVVGGRRGGRLGRSETANGTWHVGSDGTYCVLLEWEHRTEQWCRYLFSLGDKHYGVKSLEDRAADAHQFSFSH